ncbi:MAG TPA: DUF305 domain-containing protein [Gemmatimonadales bacterium]|nr:DUF305 domain-containing protein [Gemmatimonadales bacterium]
MSRFVTSATLLFAVAAAASCGGRPSGAPPAPAASPAAEFEARFRARRDSAQAVYTEADAGFMAGMIGHHAQALAMAGLAPTHGAAPDIRTLAARIVNAQEGEITIMRQWLTDRGRPAPEVHVEGAALTIHGPEHLMHMPGMLTPEQMAALDRARGPDFDRLFLTSMIQHHQGAVRMVHDLFATDGAARNEVVFKLASDIQVDQVTEIARMERMLDALSATSPRP